MSKTADDKSVADEITTTELAALVGLTVRRIQALATGGVVPRGSRPGRWPMPDAVRAYCAFLRRPVEGEGGKLTAERRALTAAKARMAELALREKEGSVIATEEVKRLCVHIATVTRDRLLVLPNKLTPRLRSISEPLAIRKLLKDEISDALNSLEDFAGRSRR